MSQYQDLRIVDNFYQTSSFIPMPTIAITTVNEDGSMNVGSYSLCFPYYIAGDHYAMILVCRNNSNTCQNLLRTHKCALNFVTDEKATFKEMVRMGYPGPSKDKMKDCKFEFEDGLLDPSDPQRPKVIKDCYQVFECTWMSDLEDGGKFKAGEMDGYEPPYNQFNGITSHMGAHFILEIDKILMEPKYANAIINGVSEKDFPNVPVDYGYRDSTYFWYTRFPRFTHPKKEGVAAPKEVDIMGIRYAANRIDDTVKFEEDALMCFAKVPRPFLNKALKGCVEWAKEHNKTTISKEDVQTIMDKRAKEKGR